MFSSSYRSSSRFPSMDLDMWDTKSCFSAQTSAWCGMAAVSGSGFQSTVSSNSGGFGHNDPGLRRWQSLSHLEPEHATRPFHPPGAELRAARGESSFRQAEVMQWLQDAHEKVDTQLGQLKTRNRQLSYNMSSAQLLDMKHKQLSEERRALERQKEAVHSSQYEKSQRHGELHEKVHKFEKDLFEMRSGVDRSNSLPAEKIHGLYNKTSPGSQEDVDKQEKQKVETEMYKLREALREAEERARTQEEERNKALQKLQTSQETQRTLMNQIEEMRQSRVVQNHSEVQEQLSDANNKISQACLEKAMLSTQVLKLEDNVKDLKVELSKAQSDKDLLIQEKANLLQRADVLEVQLKTAEYNTFNQKPDSVQMESDAKTVSEAENEKLSEELEMIKQNLEISQSQLREFKEEKIMHTKQITDLEAQCSRLTREKEELLGETNEAGHKEPSEMKEKCSQHSKPVKLLEAENQTLQDQCLCLQNEILEKEKVMHLQEEDYQKQDLERVRTIEELRTMMSHWTEKWQKVALTLQSTQEELDKYKKSDCRNEQYSDSLLRLELDACKQALELERSRSQTLLLRYTAKGDGEAQAQDKQTETDLSESSLLWEPPSDCHQNKSPQPMRQVSQDNQDDGIQQADVLSADTLRAQLDESRRRVNQLQQEKMSAVQKLQTLRELFLVKDEKPSVEDKRDKTTCPVNVDTDQQRRMVTEQLKSLFKKREDKEEGNSDKIAATTAGDSSPQDWTPSSKNVRATVDRRSWLPDSCLMPVFEEEEENDDDWPEEKEGESAASNHLHHQRQQMSALTAEICELKERNVNLQQALRFKQPIQSSYCLDERDLQRTRTPALYPDGIFKAEFVDICSPDEEEEEGDVE